MVTAYKYLDREEFATAFVEHGTIKMGTLYGYAVEELEIRSDSHEGTYRTKWDQDRPFVDPVREIVYQGNTFVRNDYSQDAYVYCASLELSKKAAGGRDWCVKISDFEAFAYALHVLLEALHGSELRRFVRPAIYASREGTSRPSANDLPFIKDTSKFEFEREIRALVYDPRPAPNHRLTAPGVVTDKALTSWLSLIALPDLTEP